MAECESLHLENRLDEIKDVLGCLSYSQEKVEAGLLDLSCVLLRCARMGEDEVRNSCFSLGIAKALLGILRSCNRVSTLSTAAKCLSLLVHANDEARVGLGELGAVSVLVRLLQPRPPAVWPEEWIPVYEQTLCCLRKLTYHCASNQQELARIGGIKLVLEMAVNKDLFSNYGRFPSEAKATLEELTLRKKLVAHVVSVKDDKHTAVLDSFPALSSLKLHYPAYFVDLATKDGEWVAAAMVEKGVAWPDYSAVIPDEGDKWTCVGVQNVEDGCNVWCQFCTEKPSAAVTKMTQSLKELVCCNGA